MISGTEKNDNPRSPSLSKFLQSLQSPVSAGYVVFRNGQIIRRDTMERWEAGLPSRKQVRVASKAKYIKEPAEPNPRNSRRIPGSKRRKLKAYAAAYKKRIQQLVSAREK